MDGKINAIHRATGQPYGVVDPTKLDATEFLYNAPQELVPSGWQGDGVLTTFNTVLPELPVEKDSVRIAAVDVDDYEMVVIDNGLGNLIGDVDDGMNIVDYAAGSVNVTFINPPKNGSSIILCHKRVDINPRVVLEVDRRHWKVDGDKLVEMSQSEKDVADGTSIASAVLEKIIEIDSNTVLRIGQGFVYDGKVFSLSVPAQSNWMRLKTWQLATSLTFPVVVSTIDSESYSIDDATTFDAFYRAMNDTVEEHIQSGRVQRELVKAMKTLAEVEVYVDPR